MARRNSITDNLPSHSKVEAAVRRLRDELLAAWAVATILEEKLGNLDDEKPPNFDVKFELLGLASSTTFAFKRVVDLSEDELDMRAWEKLEQLVKYVEDEVSR